MFGFDLPWFEKALNWTPRNVWTDKFDERMDLLSKMLALYPFTDIDKLVAEFKLTAGRINQLAQFYGVHKTKEKRLRLSLTMNEITMARKSPRK